MCWDQQNEDKGVILRSGSNWKVGREGSSETAIKIGRNFKLFCIRSWSKSKRYFFKRIEGGFSNAPPNNGLDLTISWARWIWRSHLRNGTWTMKKDATINPRIQQQLEMDRTVWLMKPLDRTWRSDGTQQTPDLGTWIELTETSSRRWTRQSAARIKHQPQSDNVWAHNLL
jgi:hypothetical protein